VCGEPAVVIHDIAPVPGLRHQPGQILNDRSVSSLDRRTTS
jgi:hypothetical protein